MKANSTVRIMEPNRSRRFVSKEECHLESGKATDYRKGKERELTGSIRLHTESVVK
jgi:hypothetical protein